MCGVDKLFKLFPRTTRRAVPMGGATGAVPQGLGAPERGRKTMHVGGPRLLIERIWSLPLLL